MFNPFIPLTTVLLQAFVNAGKLYFVRQTFNRARDHFDEGIRGYFIFNYSEAGHAQHHLGAVTHDPCRCMYDWHNPEQQRKLIIAAGQPAGYRNYSASFVADWQKHLTGPLRQKAKYYVDVRLGRKPARGQQIGFDVYVNYGEVYAKITLKTKEVRVKLEEVENLKY